MREKREKDEGSRNVGINPIKVGFFWYPEVFSIP